MGNRKKCKAKDMCCKYVHTTLGKNQIQKSVLKLHSIILCTASREGNPSFGPQEKSMKIDTASKVHAQEKLRNDDSVFLKLLISFVHAKNHHQNVLYGGANKIECIELIEFISLYSSFQLCHIIKFNCLHIIE